jgi:hypothetical protein
MVDLDDIKIATRVVRFVEYADGKNPPEHKAGITFQA